MSERPETGSSGGRRPGSFRGSACPDGRGGECPSAGAAEAAQVIEAHVLGELGPDERAAFERHLDECAACREGVEAAREIVQRLRALPQLREEECRDLVPGVLARIPDDAWSKRERPPRRSFVRRVSLFARAPASVAASVAACIAVAAVGVLVVRGRSGRDAGDSERMAKLDKVVARALDWLASSQEADGSWAPGRWGGQPKYTAGLTGLAVLSFLAEEDPLEGPHAVVVRRGVDYLLASRVGGTRFGPAFSGALYNHGIATVALLETYSLTGDERLKQPITRALSYISSKRKASGGWGYVDSRRANTAISVWQLNALLLASLLDWPGERAHAEKGLAWLEGLVDSEGLAGYDAPGSFPYGPEGPTAMAAFLLSAGSAVDRAQAGEIARGFDRVTAVARRDLDYCRSYFFAYARRAVESVRSGGSAPRDEPRGARTPSARVARGLDVLLESQVSEGPNSGSFEPLDRWSLTGGRVYATAMATLSLQAEERAPRLLAMMRGPPR